METLNQKDKSLAPIALFVYNRPWHTQQTIEALKKNDLAKKSELYIFSDAPKSNQEKENVDKIRQYIKSIDGFKSIKIIERERNLGLADSVISGVTKIINKFGKVIVIEDDLEVAPNFLEYMNQMLDLYEGNGNIFSITGYNYPLSTIKIPISYKYDVYFNPRASSWGWGTWNDRWNVGEWDVSDYECFKKDKIQQKKFNRWGEDLTELLNMQMRGEIDSWAIRWSYTHFKNNAYCVYPVQSFINNLGHDGTGVHCSSDKKGFYKNEKLNSGYIKEIPANVFEDEHIKKIFSALYKRGTIYKIKRFLFKLLKHYL